MVGIDSRNNIDKELMKIEDPIQRQRVRAYYNFVLNEKLAEIELKDKDKSRKWEGGNKSKGIPWRRTRTGDIQQHKALDFNTFFNEHKNEYKNSLLNDDDKKERADFVLIERHNLEKITTRFDLYPNPIEHPTEQIVSHMRVQKNVDQPDYYMQIFHARAPETGQEIVVFLGCARGKRVGKHETFHVEREIKHDIFLESRVKGFRQIEDPLKGGSKKWYIEDDFV